MTEAKDLLSRLKGQWGKVVSLLSGELEAVTKPIGAKK